MLRSISKHFFISLAATFLVAGLAVPALAQLGGLGGLGDKLKSKTPNLLRPKLLNRRNTAVWVDGESDGVSGHLQSDVVSVTDLVLCKDAGFMLARGEWRYNEAISAARIVRPAGLDYVRPWKFSN